MINWSKERVFVTGGSGVIGRVLIDRLLSLGASVFTGDLEPIFPRWQGKVEGYLGDLNDLDGDVLKAFSPTVCFHLAATFERSDETYPFWEENFHHNVRLSHYILGLLKNLPSCKKVVFASSYLIYDPSLYLFESPEPPVSLKESSALSPRNLCGAAKFFHEKELHFFDNFCQSAFSSVSARIFRSYGRGSKDVISRWIRAALRAEPLDVYLPEGRFDYIFADDVAEGLLRLAACKEARGAYNLGSGNSRSVSDVVSILKSHFPHLVVKTSAVKGTYESSVADMTRTKEILGWSPSHSLETTIPQIIDYEKSMI